MVVRRPCAGRPAGTVAREATTTTAAEDGPRVTGPDVAGPPAPRDELQVGDRVLTLPNAISLARLLCVPVFAALILDGRDGAALAVLLAAGASDFVDGQLARRWDQVTRLGQLLDPAADRLYVTAALLGLGWRGVLPWELVGLVVLREVVLTLNVLVLRRHGLSSLPPHLLGKAATLLLLVALPLLLLAETAEPLAVVVRPVAWALVLWGSALYWWAGVGYLWQTHRLVGAVRAQSSVAGPGVPRG